VLTGASAAKARISRTKYIPINIARLLSLTDGVSVRSVELTRDLQRLREEE
jgi:hypothetical protein